jgi:DNA-binding transcriptional regulator YhcF (GntR family)
MYQCIETKCLVLMDLSVDPSSPTPPFEQIRAQLQQMIAGGTLRDGARLPPIRQLAGDLGLANNTVARAYRELEIDGLVVAKGRHGTVVKGRVAMNRKQREQVVDRAAETFAREVQHHGVGLDDALEAVHRAFGGFGSPGSAIDGRAS